MDRSIAGRHQVLIRLSSLTGFYETAYPGLSGGGYTAYKYFHRQPFFQLARFYRQVRAEEPAVDIGEIFTIEPAGLSQGFLQGEAIGQTDATADLILRDIRRPQFPGK